MGGLVDRSLLVSHDANKKKPAKPAKPAGLKAAAAQMTATPASQGLMASAPAAAPPSSEATERVGALLAYGLLFLPFVFAWVVQKQNYSKRVRQLSLGWMTVMVVVIVLSAVARPQRVPPLTSPQKAAAVAAAAAPAITTFATVAAELSGDAPATPAAAKPAAGWQYETAHDEMRNTTTRYATLESKDVIEFGFPYGAQRVTLTVRDRPEDGLKVLLTTEAQFMCNEYNNDTVAVKFDDGAVDHFGCGEPSAGSTGVMFIGNPKRFVENLRNAKQVIVEPSFFQRGREQVKFDTANLEWK